MSLGASSSYRAASLVLCVALGIIIAQFPLQLGQDSLLRPLSYLSSWREAEYICPQPAYVLRMISYDPFVAHLENFITLDEAKYVKELAELNLLPSEVFTKNHKAVKSKARTSRTAHLDHSDPVVQCIKRRASEIQGYYHMDHISMQATVYSKGQFFGEHHDCSGMERLQKTGALFRASTIFGILEATCENCGTSFPYLKIDRTPVDSRICEFIECDREYLTVKAKTGSAVFWRNRYANGTQDDRMIHEGLPVVNGSKYGMNIWSHELRGPVEANS